MPDTHDNHAAVRGLPASAGTRAAAVVFDPAIPSLEEREIQLRWLLTLRITAVSTVLGAILYIHFLAGTTSWSLRPLFWVVLLAYVHSLVVAVAHNLGAAAWRPFAAVQLAVDVVLETLLVYFLGGMQSPFIVLYLLTVAAAGIMLTQRNAMLFAAYAAVGYGTVGLASYSGLRQWLPIDAGFEAGFIGGMAQAGELYLRFFAMMLTCFVVAWLSSTLTRRVRETGQELRARESELASLQQLNTRIIQGMSGGLLATDDAGTVVILNSAAEEITGRSGRELTGGKIWEAFGDDRAWFRRLRERLQDRRIHRTERTIRAADGSVKIIGMTVTLIEEDVGTDEGVLVFMFRDLTEIRRMEQELRLRERMAVLGEMAGSIAHEIRNPLASISGSLQLLEGAKIDSDNPDAADLIKIVVKESKRLSKTLDDFLEYARPGDLDLEEADLEELVGETLALLRNSAELRSDHVVEVDAEGGSFLATVDASQIKQVFWNLARNAIQAMPTGGRLRVSLCRADDDIEICFEDTGKGMAPDEIDTFFQPYVSGRSDGTGLGLSVVYKILERHGVTIEVDSEPGEGTRILMSFEAAVAEADQRPADDSAAEAEEEPAASVPAEADREPVDESG